MGLTHLFLLSIWRKDSLHSNQEEPVGNLIHRTAISGVESAIRRFTLHLLSRRDSC